jgi:hypothetical protein
LRRAVTRARFAVVCIGRTGCGRYSLTVTQVSIDAPKLASRLRERAGFAPEHAEETAQAIADALADQLVSQSDLRTELGRLESKLDARIAESKSDLTRLVLTVANGQTALFLAAMFSLARSPH